MVLISGAVTIHAVIYPMYPFGVESVRTAFSRAIFGLFLTKIDDLDGKIYSIMYVDTDFALCFMYLCVQYTIFFFVIFLPLVRHVKNLF